MNIQKQLNMNHTNNFIENLLNNLDFSNFSIKPYVALIITILLSFFSKFTSYIQYTIDFNNIHNSNNGLLYFLEILSKILAISLSTLMIYVNIKNNFFNKKNDSKEDKPQK